MNTASRNTTLRISGFSTTASTEKVREYISSFGPFTSFEHVAPEGSVYVTFQKRISAASLRAATMAVDPTPFGRLQADWADSQSIHSSILVRFRPYQVESSSTPFTPETLKELFSTFGEVVRVDLPKGEEGKFRGVAFVHFRTNSHSEQV